MAHKTLLSGIQPSGNLHIGNYLGAIKQWVELQKSYKVFISIVDHHAITVPQDPKQLRKNTLELAALLIACGINPEKSVLFVQSHVPAHTELGWILITLTPVGELERMTQFKEKAHIKYDHIKTISEGLKAHSIHLKLAGDLSKKIKKELEIKSKYDKDIVELLHQLYHESIFDTEHLLNVLDVYDEISSSREKTLAGLLNYPVLQAADILLYQPDVVPVGEDQLQHLEFTRTLARKFNNRFGQAFKEPKALIEKSSARIMGLDDPSKKMSKSSANPNSYIALLDSPEEIRRKIKIAVTDSGSDIRYDEKSKPAISNLMTIYSAFSGIPISQVEKKYRAKGYAYFKRDLAELLVDKLSPIQKKYRELVRSQKPILATLAGGTKKANEIAQKTLIAVKDKMGFLSI